MDNYEVASLLQEPQDYYPPSPPPTEQCHTLQDGRRVALHLVGHSATEAHHVWNGSRFVADLFEAEPERVRGRSVLELGAGAGLPSLVAGLLGARRVVMTDFPDPAIVAAMQRNVDEAAVQEVVRVLGFVWGGDAAPLLAALAPQDKGFDVLVLADLLFRHSEHGALVRTICQTMRRTASSAAYVFFTSYRPWKQDADMAFFDVARAAGLAVRLLAERKLDAPLFADDPGDVEVQKTVRGFMVRWPDSASE
ncbi:hypothetical protein CDD81_7089 [Ophiocordyceps australis]|uniref:Elongation factor methyltransferase 7 n=1 Tax=Ophiocordyceps australis TaxID=1399860 RepID=A0A2C5Y4A8_9HYPO|nr:hypothetical protein CDD81_7089 [Ophiocordyceps australis]